MYTIIQYYTHACPFSFRNYDSLLGFQSINLDHQPPPKYESTFGSSIFSKMEQTEPI